MSKNILVTGANGQVAKELKELSKLDEYSNFNFLFVDRDELDITKRDKLDNFFNENSIDIIINCAAYTDVEGAENNKEEAYRVNYEGVKNLAQIAKDKDIKLIHISTDYIFDGKKHFPYTEEDKPNPQSIYAKSKLKGEEAIIEINPKFVIIRTSWVYSKHNRNFVKSILNKSQEIKNLKVVCDQIGSPTYARDLAKVILEIVKKDKINSIIYHYSNEGSCSWYDFAKAIVEICDIKCNIEPIATKDYPAKAIRPFFGVLDKSKIKRDLNIKIPYWRDSLEECLNDFNLSKQYKIGIIGSDFITKV